MSLHRDVSKLTPSNSVQADRAAMMTSTSNQFPGKSDILTRAKRLVSYASAGALVMATALQPFALMSVGTASAETINKNYIRISPENAAIPKMINLGLNKSLGGDLPAEANDGWVANPTVADAVMRTSRRIYLFGKQIGQTNIFIFDGSGKQIAAMEILIERDITGLETSLARLIPQSNIKAEMINDNIVLTGTVATPLDATKAVSLARIFVTGGPQQPPSPP